MEGRIERPAFQFLTLENSWIIVRLVRTSSLAQYWKSESRHPAPRLTGRVRSRSM